MLNKIELKNFKCFAKLELELRGLNIFRELTAWGNLR